MYKPLTLIVLLLTSSFTVLDVSSIDVSIEETGEETPRPMAINYIPFKEVATIVIDEKDDKMMISYSLLSKDKEDFKIPDSLEAKILGIEKIVSIVYTSEENCALGVLNATCILINIPLKEIKEDEGIMDSYDPETGIGYKDMQKAAREISDSVIDDINQALAINVKYHSVVAQTDYGLTNEEDAVLSVVYTMYDLPAKLLFNMFILQNITEETRMAAGFFNHAKDLTADENSEFKFSMIVEPTRILYSLHLSVISSDNEIELDNFSPLDLLHVDKLNRSKLFADGFYPLNSIVNVIIFSERELQVLKTNSEVIASIGNANELQKNGWYFISSKSDSDNEINKLDLRYLFGKTNSVSKQQLLLSIIPIVDDVTPIEIGEWLPVGVKSPAPNFEREFGTITGLYEEIGSPKKNYTYTWGMELIKGAAAEITGTNILGIPDDTKIIKGDETELLVFNLFIPNNDDTSAAFYPQDSKMYDGKDRVFDSLTHEFGKPTGWSEECLVNPVMIQPGQQELMKLCFEIPKDADHFKIVTLLPYYNDPRSDSAIGGYYDIVAMFDRLGIGEDALPQPAEETNQGGGCLIATAAFGSEMAPQVQLLRELRDNIVLQTESGTSFMAGFNQFYYSFSPTIADYERENQAFKETVKLALTPLLTSLTLLQYADIDSESEMLGYGIGVILLNIGMYFVAPAILVMKIKKLIEKPHLKN